MTEAETIRKQKATITNKVALDFTGLFEETSTTQPEPPEPLLAENKYNYTTEPKKPTTEPTEGLEGIAPLQRQANAHKAELERARAAYKAYQDNIKTSCQLKADILQGIQRGENIYPLFLQAIKAISFMTSDTLFYTQAEQDLIVIYGKGLDLSPPLELELEKVQERLRRLRDAASSEKEPDSKERLKRAIEAHEKQAVQLTKQIEESKERGQ